MNTISGGGGGGGGGRGGKKNTDDEVSLIKITLREKIPTNFYYSVFIISRVIFILYNISYNNRSNSNCHEILVLVCRFPSIALYVGHYNTTRKLHEVN